MPLLESLLSVIAPHNCLGCGCEGSLFCGNCVEQLPFTRDDACFSCGQRPASGMLCVACRKSSSLDGIKARTSHEGTGRQLVHHLKFERAYAAAQPIAGALCELLPRNFANLNNVMVVSVPTASSRVRVRGYDQAAVIARLFARRCRLPYYALLGRQTQFRQVGASREKRLSQLKHAFYVRRPGHCSGRTVIVIDDVLTTGSTLESCAGVLREAGAVRVFGLVFARQPRTKKAPHGS